MNKRTIGTLEMIAAMLISGTIGWFVVRSGQPVIELLFWRRVFGAATLLVVCAITGSLWGKLSLKHLGWATLLSSADRGSRTRADCHCHVASAARTRP